MATNLVKWTDDTAIVWADSTDYDSSSVGLVRTAQLDLTSVAAGAARQGAKVDFGVTRADKYRVYVGIEFVSAAVSSEEVEIFHAGSPTDTVGSGNPGGTNGTDSDYTGTAGDSLADSLQQLQRIGSLVTTSDNTNIVQYQTVGYLNGADIERHGMPVVYLNTTGAAVADANQMLIAYIPVNPDIQAAV